MNRASYHIKFLFIQYIKLEDAKLTIQLCHSRHRMESKRKMNIVSTWKKKLTALIV